MEVHCCFGIGKNKTKRGKTAKKTRQEYIEYILANMYYVKLLCRISTVCTTESKMKPRKSHL